MTWRVVVIALVAWLFGLLTALGYVAASGYEYALAADHEPAGTRWTELTEGGWEPVAIGGDLFLRRPRVRIR